MHVSIRKWGNSPSVRIPASVMAAAKLRVDQKVDVYVENDRVVIEPVRAADPAFAAALSGTLGEWATPEDDAAWADL